jgi:hypothetical protein
VLKEIIYLRMSSHLVIARRREEGRAPAERDTSDVLISAIVSRGRAEKESERALER